MSGSKSEQAYEYIKEEIISNRLAQGTPLLEIGISEKLGISRAPVREAIRQLERDGLIVSYPGRGSFVTTITPYDVEEIYDLRVLSEVWALEHSLNRISTEEMAHFEDRFLAASQSENWELTHKVDRDFHSLLISRAGNKRLMQFMNVLYLQVEWTRRMSTREKSRRNSSLEEHLAIIQAMRARDMESSKEMLIRHLRSVEKSTISIARMGQSQPEL